MLDEILFPLIAQDIEKQGFSVRLGALPADLANALFIHQQTMEKRREFKRAGVGRNENYLKNGLIRTDKIAWITGDSHAEKQWLEWTANLQISLNRHLFLGLFSFESHFAHYKSGDYYKRHYDAFRGETNRILSVVAYFNTGWTMLNGGELALYMNDHDKEGIKVSPLLGTLVTFLSEEFPHEVLPANRDRYSIAGWFRVNTSVTNKVDLSS